ncbi:unnamed protein product [Eruca vesicaria subsp. sativa]|uniref:Uncharacterized protein n=1 Tax=Eruca vesicaria subsp. sativa TaxID=29727 RepID=A0ABC8JM06_ERUVS|nr:unnamed protein product [Eruca vesicaria subsp. sativa]
MLISCVICAEKAIKIILWSIARGIAELVNHPEIQSKLRKKSTRFLDHAFKSQSLTFTIFHTSKLCSRRHFV